jgi:hypothetical protein
MSDACAGTIISHYPRRRIERLLILLSHESRGKDDERRTAFVIEHFPKMPVAGRFEIIHSLAAARSKPARALLIHALRTDPSPLVRHEAAFVVGYIGGPRELQEAQRALKQDPSFLVRHEAAMALAEIGTLSDLALLTECTADENEEVTISCEFAIARIRARCGAPGNPGQ